MNIRVDMIRDNDAQIVGRLSKIEEMAFGKAGLNEWTIVPLIRHGKVFALWHEREVIGGAQFIRDWKDPSRAYLVGIALDKNQRGKGLGTRFLAECLVMLKGEGVNSVELTVDAVNQPAAHVYQEKLGFGIVEERKDEYGAGENRLVMERML
jgi:ribosomal-protein-alanine N-acetyltransferase